MTRRLLILMGALVLALASCGGSDSDSGNGGADTVPVEVGPADAAAGEDVYNSICIACHGRNGEGITGNGKALIASEFVAGLTADELVEFIKNGRNADHPENSTGIDMPPRGGRDDLSEQDLVDVAAFIRTL